MNNKSRKVIIGIGGGGQAIINNFRLNNCDLRLICINSDEQILDTIDVEKWLINEKKAVFYNGNFIKNLFYKLIKQLPFYKQSFGCGGNIEIGRNIIIKHLNCIRKELQTMDEITIISTFGGGFGTGVTPIIVKEALSMNIKINVFVTTPFDFEGKKRMRNALCGIDELKKYFPDVHVYNNQKLLEYLPENKRIMMKDAFNMVNKKIYRMHNLSTNKI